MARLAQFAERPAHATDCSGNECSIVYEFAEITVTEGDGDPATQFLWGKEAHLDPGSMFISGDLAEPIIDPITGSFVGYVELYLEERQ